MGRTKQTDNTNTTVKDSATIANPDLEVSTINNAEGSVPAEEEIENSQKEEVIDKESASEELEISDEPENADNSIQAKKNTIDRIETRVLELMRLYPHYEEIWITPEGFVRPKGVNENLTKGAKLYKNLYYN